MLGDKWITDRTPTERFPAYTRANAGEVLADPVTPLGWDFCWESGVVLGCRDGFVSFGVFDPEEYGNPPESFGSFGGYFYNTLTQARLMGVRMPGASPEAIDQAYFDNHPDVPPYKAEPWHESERHAAKLEGTMGLLFSATSYRPIDDQKVIAKQVRDSRPDLSKLSNAELLDRARSIQPHIVAMFEQHVWASLGASFGPGAIGALTAELGRPTDAIKLVTGIGDVDSAEIARSLWALSRLVRADAALSTTFDAGIDGVLAATAGTSFAAKFNEFIYEHGSRGPNEWDPGAPSYESNPRIALAQIDKLRFQDDSADPAVSFTKNSAERERIRGEVAAALAGSEEAAGTFAAAMQSASVFLAARERCKGNNIRVIHEVRMCFDEIGRRMVAAGHLPEARHFYMLREAELDAYIANPGSFAATLAERAADLERLGELEPPFIVNGSCPPISTWKRKDAIEVDHVSDGQVLAGTACAPGVYTGTARVILRADDPGALEPGDILVTFNTDPSWTPLFLAAGAVVANVGALGSHASIVSRELGIPCVASVPDATRRIPDGATITVDGTNGTVTIVKLPAVTSASDATPLSIPTTIDVVDEAWLTKALGAEVTSFTTTQIGEGVGIMGQLFKVTPTYKAGSSGPTSAIVKLPSPFEENRAQGVALGMYEAEVRFYKELAASTSTPTPVCHGGTILPGTADFVLVLEDLGHLNMADEVAGMSLAQAEAAIDALAALHRSWWGRTGADEFAWLPTLDHPRIAAVSSVYPQLWEGFCAKFGDRLSPAAKEHGDTIAGSWGNLMAALAKRPNTLLHMDFRCENMFFDGPVDRPNRVVVFDWQAIGRGPGVYDLAYLLGGSLPTEVRRANEGALLHRYHDALGQATYSYDEFFADFCAATKVVTATPVFTGATLDLANERGKALIGGMGERLFASVVDHA